MAVSPRSAVQEPLETEASIGQRLLWLLDHYRGGEGTINVPIGWRIRRPLDVDALKAALAALVDRHETLRTTYVSRRRRLIQQIHDGLTPPFRFTDMTAQRSPEDAALAAMDREVRTDLDPALAPVTVHLWRIAADDHLLLINLHHLATDFFSNMILTRDLGWLYDLTVGVATDPLPPVQWSYAQWSGWQAEAFANGRQAALQAFWTEVLAGSRGVSLPRVQRGAGDRDASRNEKETLDLDPAVVESLRTTARQLRTTMFSVMLAVFYVHLGRFTGERDMSVSSLFTNRGRPEIANTAGFFVNMIVLRGRLDPAQPFTELARGTRSIVVKALANADLPLQLLPARTVGPGTEDVVFQFLEAPPSHGCSLDPEVLDITVSSGRFALELVVYNHEHLMVRSGREFDGRWARSFLDEYGALAERVAADPSAPVQSWLGG
jgi:Condensation domain